MNVLLAPFDIAGTAAAIRDGLREGGVHADLWTIAPYPYARSEDRLIEGYRARVTAGAAAAHRYDVLHYQFGTTLLEFLDAAYARARRRPLLLMHYWGDDCRLRLRSNARPLGAGPGWEEEQRRRERTLVRRLRLAGRLCHAAIVSDLELAADVVPWVPTTFVVPTPLVLPRVERPATPPAGSGPVVFHAPSERLVKGSVPIEAAVRRCAARTPLRYRAVSGVSHDEVLAALATADVVVDQLNARTTGVFALEAMALGKPVLSQYEPDLLAPDIRRRTPIVPVTEATLEHELERLLHDPDRRHDLGERGRRFVAETHADDVVARRLLTVYDQARGIGPGLFEVTSDAIRPLPSPLG